MKENWTEVRKKLGHVLTMQYDYPPNGEGAIGYKGFNMYRFKEEDVPEIQLVLAEQVEKYKYSYNIDILAQEMITELLDKGLIVYGGYGYKKQQKEHHSI